ncbi:lyase family protein [Streptomyces sp. NPDC051561]|uniref:lyase family protein n=1 Tax=Streptomyces sp. NPDC051561 TaxID=3365658 RepID=UPI0037943FA6
MTDLQHPAPTTPQAGVDTGRLRTALHPEAHRIVYDQYLGDRAAVAELGYISEVDRAHLVMLTERGLIPTEPAARLLHAIDGLRADDFHALRERPIPRGVYLAYEGWLTETLGADTGGVLHTGRSRNDLNATTARLRTRDALLPLLAEVRSLAATLLERATAYRAVTMPAYTHGQPAVPITYGHYLAALAAAVLRGLDDLLAAGREAEHNPLGAGAVGGTSVAIDPARTAALLGFEGCAVNSVDAVASREFALRLLSASAVLGVAMARAGRDLSTWTAEESGLLRLADDLVGSSSMMPQKRNPFLLEHIHSRGTAALGGFTAAVTAMSTAGYTNAIAVGTEAMRHLWPGLSSTADTATLLRLVIAGAEPDEQRMRAIAVNGHTTATYYAERLVAEGMPFRAAHHEVGATVLAALDHGHTLSQAAEERPGGPGDRGADWLDPANVAQACAYGGGPGGGEVSRTLSRLEAELARLDAELEKRRTRWSTARQALDAAVARITAVAA